MTDKAIVDDLFYLGTTIFGSIGICVILYILLRANNTTSKTLILDPNSIGELTIEIVLCFLFLAFIVFSFLRYLFKRFKNP